MGEQLSYDLYCEILENARRDRERLEKLLDNLKETASEDPLSIPSLLEVTVTATEALTRVNAQIVELSKIITKRDMLDNTHDDEFSDDETQDVFDEIEKSN